MKALSLPQSLLDCLAPNEAALTITAAIDLIVKNMKVIHGSDYRDFDVNVNHESGFVMIVGRRA